MLVIGDRAMRIRRTYTLDLGYEWSRGPGCHSSGRLGGSRGVDSVLDGTGVLHGRRNSAAPRFRRYRQPPAKLDVAQCQYLQRAIRHDLMEELAGLGSSSARGRRRQPRRSAVCLSQ